MHRDAQQRYRNMHAHARRGTEICTQRHAEAQKYARRGTQRHRNMHARRYRNVHAHRGTEMCMQRYRNVYARRVKRGREVGAHRGTEEWARPSDRHMHGLRPRRKDTERGTIDFFLIDCFDML
jgi:hypothetical protein